MTTVHDVATFFIARASEDGNLLTHLKLQKLCYYAQGYSLALIGEAMFSEPIEAWEHGPVVRALYDEYKQFRKRPIPADAGPPELESWRTRVLEMVHQRFGWMTAWELRNRTHAEIPWREAWLSNEVDAELSNESMREFFRTSLSGERRQPKPADRALVMQRLAQNRDLREATAKGRDEVASGRGRRWN